MATRPRAIVLRFVDQLQDVTDRVLFRDYSAEKFAFCRVATELDAAATRAGLCLPRHLSSHFRIGCRMLISCHSDSRITSTCHATLRAARWPAIQLGAAVMRCLSLITKE